MILKNYSKNYFLEHFKKIIIKQVLLHGFYFFLFTYPI